MNRATPQGELIALGQRSYAPNYQPRNIVLKSARGCEVTDVDGNAYLDFNSGIGVNCLGHQHPAVVKALTDQASQLWHSSNVYFNEPAIRLASTLIERTFAQRVYFCNSGTEANEAAIKAARRYGYDQKGSRKHVIITLNGSFHGRTLGALSATAQPKYHEGFTPLPPGFRYCEFNDCDQLRSLVDADACAVMLEPIQGERGIRSVSEEFLQTASELCQAHDALLICDEIQSGMGRTGKLFAYQWADGVAPDIVTVAKALGAGMPIGATLFGPKVADTLRVGSHGSTFGGNPIACAVANAVINELHTGNRLADIAKKGARFKAGLKAIDERTSAFGDIRVRGLMIGAELAPQYTKSAADVLHSCLDNGLLILQAGERVLRLLPPYTVSDSEIQSGLERLEKALADALKP